MHLTPSERTAELTPSQPRRAQVGKLFLLLAVAAIGAICVLPLVIVISASLSSERSLVEWGYSLLPREFSIAAYAYLWHQPDQLAASYGITTFVTVTGTLGGLLLSSLLAYPLARRDFRWRRPLSFYVFFTMLFNGGLVPTYIVVSQVLHLKDTVWALILPYLIVPWFVLLLRTFFAMLPVEIIESAQMDGFGEYRLFFRIVLPLSTPVLATVALFASLNYWNDWFLALLYIDDRRLLPLQYLLVTIIQNIEAINMSANTVTTAAPAESVRMATAVLAIGPIVFVYSFLQKYFVQGLTVGAIKG
ncbi:carbohydrate ABC transporter permease [Cohnella rhizosphaerae]|uniref:Carbohydrate ABC transporter permease n=1 Tax=Cohnella rhizosphaerae TaxID=1457232 RepID=A0A9X4KNS2_9BACL|nr:carbohydrate ABC transporter permease [Cohnella rhizosphaerae]MDG0808050.1 carbohydrate ABC transporter permease [Cohnella rhizosphaerae]